MPGILGMFQSEMMKSILSLFRVSQALLPSSASMMLLNPSCLRMFFMILRMVEKSSTTRMRISLLAAMAVLLLVRLRHCRLGAAEAVWRRCLRRGRRNPCPFCVNAARCCTGP